MSVLSRSVHAAGKLDADALIESGALLQVQIAVPPALALSLERARRPIPAPINGVALIDTGATRTGVARRVQRALEIEAVGRAGIATAGGRREVPRFPVSLSFPGTEIPQVHLTKAIGCELGDHAPHLLVLLGRDFLANCLFIHNGPLGQITLAM